MKGVGAQEAKKENKKKDNGLGGNERGTAWERRAVGKGRGGIRKKEEGWVEEKVQRRESNRGGGSNKR